MPTQRCPELAAARQGVIPQLEASDVHVDAASSVPATGTVTAPPEFASYGVMVANHSLLRLRDEGRPRGRSCRYRAYAPSAELAFLRTLTKIRKGAHSELDQIDTGRGTAVTVTFDCPGRVLPDVGAALPLALQREPDTAGLGADMGYPVPGPVRTFTEVVVL